MSNSADTVELDPVVAVVPHMLGHVPVESLVVVWVSENGSLVQAERLDLADVAEHLSPSFVLEEIVYPMSRAPRVMRGVYAFVLVVSDSGVYTPSGEFRYTTMVDEVVDVLTGNGFAVPAAIRVSGGRWWEFGCDAGCCPREGRVVSERAVATAATVFGEPTPFETRAEIEAGFMQVGHPAREIGQQVGVLRTAVRAAAGGKPEAVHARVVLRQTTHALVQTIMSPSRNVTRDDLVVLAAAMTDTAVRDATLMDIVVLGEDAPERGLFRLGRLFQDAAVGAGKYGAGAFTVAAVAFWLAGDGTRATLACIAALDIYDVPVDAPLEIDSSPVAAVLLASIRCGAHPAEWAAGMLAGMSTEPAF